LKQLRTTTIGLSLALAVVLAGCDQGVDLAQVRALAQTVQSAAPSYTSIADDQYDSCLRQVGWANFAAIAPLTATETSPPTPAPATTAAPVSPTAAATPAPVASATPAPTASDALAEAAKLNGGKQSPYNPMGDVKACDPFITSVAETKAVQSLLVSYFTQLGAAAGDDSKVNYGFATLATDDKRLSSAQQTALSGAATDIATAIFQARRRALTADQATRAKTAVDFLITRLTDAAGEYLLELGYESSAINSFYGNNFVVLNPGLERLESIQYRLNWKAALDDVQSKRAAEAAYVKSLETLGKGNDAIVKAAAANDAAGIYAAATAATALLEPDITALKKVFK
jgi:hypothetical protein